MLMGGVVEAGGGSHDHPLRVVGGAECGLSLPPASSTLREDLELMADGFATPGHDDGQEGRDEHR